MNIPQIQITTTKAVLGVRTSPSSLSIEQPRAILTQEQPRAVLNMSQTNPKLSVGSTEVRVDLDMKSAFRRTADVAQMAKQDVLEGTGRRASEGQQLMRIENGGNQLSQISKQNATPPPAPLGIKFIPDPSKLQISIEPGMLDVDVQIQKPINEVTVNAPILRYTPGHVSGEMEQWPSIQIDVKL